MMHLQTRRVRLGLCQHEIAAIVGTSQSEVSRVERNPNHPSAGKLARVLSAALAGLERRRGLKAIRDFRIFERRMALKLTQRQLGELAGFPTDWQAEARVQSVEDGRGLPTDLQQVRRALVWEETKVRRVRERRRSEDARVARAEAVWNAVPESPAKMTLLTAMLDRCVELMHDNEGEACDAITDWLPKPAVEKMFQRWWAETLADRKCCACRPDPDLGFVDKHYKL